MDVSRVNSSIAKCLREFPDVGKIDTKYEGRFPVICTMRMRTRSYTSMEPYALDLSSQVCTTNEFNVSVLMTLARLVGL